MDKYLGKRLDGRYEMRELIGVGGMAYVYKAYDAIDDRIVAVKILRDEFLANEEFVRRFRNESKAIAILNHPNIVKVLDVGFGERLQYIVMEYIDGITLKEYLDQRKDLRWKEAVHFTVQILRALQHAHDKGIVHRDIKPQNIMLLSDGTIKVTDFGIARLTRTEMQATAVGNKAIGSVHYISPEQARGDITDEKADLYSVGIMLYEMLTGRLPFEAETAVSVAIKQMTSEATAPHLINEDIPEGLEQITLKAMQKETAKRYQSAAEMLSDIDDFKRNPSIKFAYTYFEDDTPTRYVDAITQMRGETDEDTAKKPKDGKKKLSNMAILGLAAGAVVLAAVIFLLVFGSLRNNKRDEIKVDNFVGMSYVDEVSLHKNIGNYQIITETGYNPNYPEGVVYDQDPAPGRTIKMKGRLILYISKGSKQVEIPKITPGESAELVRNRLTGAGFVVIEAEESSDECKKGTVVRLSPEPGEKAQYGSEVTMYISTGKSASDPIEVPNVVNLEVNSAIDQLVSAGFERNKIKTEYVSNAVAKDTVISVNPGVGTSQQPDVNIVLTVSTGLREVTIRLDLPKTDTLIDLQFFVDGQLDRELTNSYLCIQPNKFNNKTGVVNFTVNNSASTYEVTVAIAKSGTNEYANYAVYTVNGAKGTYKLTKKYTFVDPGNNAGGETTTQPAG